jgi:AcrR family transcriptional regulator
VVLFLEYDAGERLSVGCGRAGHYDQLKTEISLHLTVGYPEKLFHLVGGEVSEVRHNTGAPRRRVDVRDSGGAQQRSTPVVVANPKQLRRDAVRNRQLVLDAAADAFAESGLEVGYDEIARRAGVGVGTVYRRFPQRAELIMALFESRVDEAVKMAISAGKQPDGWSALSWFLEQVLALQARDRGLQEVLAGGSQRDERFVQARDRIVLAVSALLNRAKDEGAVRPDVEPTDIGALMMVISSMATARQPELWRRYLALLLDALRPRPDGSTALPMTAPVEAEMDELVHRPRGAH